MWQHLFRIHLCKHFTIDHSHINNGACALMYNPLTAVIWQLLKMKPNVNICNGIQLFKVRWSNTRISAGLYERSILSTKTQDLLWKVSQQWQDMYCTIIAIKGYLSCWGRTIWERHIHKKKRPFQLGSASQLHYKVLLPLIINHIAFEVPVEMASACTI